MNSKSSQSPHEIESIAIPLALVLLLTALVTTAYWGVQHNDFVYDDVWLVENNRRIQNLDGIGAWG